jgi:[ribosomal protein S5]-alanine N-acetyltransferase
MSATTRLVTLEDAAGLAEYFRINRAFHAPWDPDRPEEHFTAAGQRAQIATALEGYRERRALPLVIARGDLIVGRVHIRDVVGPPMQFGTLGFNLAESATGQGLATAAVADACALGFAELGLERIEAATIVTNHASQRVMQRAGFTEIGRPRRYIEIGGERHDALLYERLRDD